MAIHVKDSKFILSATCLKETPPTSISEIAFLGRSNVGKSTFINLLLNVKGLAKSSNTPGKTQLINYFKSSWAVEEETIELYLVDLPGFGYAKVSKELQKKWEKNLKDFLQNRQAIKLFLQLRDARHPCLPIDDQALSFIQNFKNSDQKIVQIFTKCDKLSKNDLRTLKMRHKEALFSSMPLSAENREELLRKISSDVLGK